MIATHTSFNCGMLGNDLKKKETVEEMNGLDLDIYEV